MVGIKGSILIFDNTEVVFEKDFEKLFTFLKERREAENEYQEKLDPERRFYHFESRYNESDAKQVQGINSVDLIYHVNNISEYLATGKLSQKLPDAEKLIGNIENNQNEDSTITETIVSNVESESGDDITPAPQKTATTEHILCVTAICILSVVLIVFVMLTARKRKTKE